MLNEFISTFPLFFLIIISILVTLLTSLITKYFTDQKEMKKIKDEMNKRQKDMKKTKDPKELSKIQKEVLKLNSEYFKHSMKATMFTFLPILLIFAWLIPIYSEQPFEPGSELEIEIISNKIEDVSLELPDEIALLNKTETQKSAIFLIKSEKEGEYEVNILPCNESFNLISSNSLVKKTPSIIKTENQCASEIRLKYQSLKFNIFGLKLGWFWIYLIISLITSSIFKKIFKIF